MGKQQLRVTKARQVTKRELAVRYKRHVSDGGVPSMHWFRDASKWRHLSFSYNNPYNIVSVHSEMFLISGLGGEIIPALRERTLVFLGVGVGDTEMLLIEGVLDSSGEVGIVAIDVNIEFLDDFENSLRNKSLENDSYAIRLHNIEGVFEDIESGDIKLGDSGKRAIICLGNTIGNYIDTIDFVRIIQRIASTGDVVLLGYQLDTYAQKLFDKYKSNPIFTDFVLSYAPHKDKHKLRWVFDKERTAVTAYYDGTRVFFSKKFNFGTVRGLMQAAGFETVVHRADGAKNSCILLSRCTRE